MHSFKPLWSRLRSSFWFMPTLMVAASVALAITLVEAESAVSRRWLAPWPLLFGARPEAARQLLSTIAGSMITVAGVVFSITIVALSLASGQFGPRLLRNFMRDRSNQFVLGTFTGTYVYCLLVLRTVRGADGNQFVPGIAVALGFLLALASPLAW